MCFLQGCWCWLALLSWGGVGWSLVLGLGAGELGLDVNLVFLQLLGCFVCVLGMGGGGVVCPPLLPGCPPLLPGLGLEPSTLEPPPPMNQ